jgi:hypothetical protein
MHMGANASHACKRKKNLKGFKNPNGIMESNIIKYSICIKHFERKLLLLYPG